MMTIHDLLSWGVHHHAGNLEQAYEDEGAIRELEDFFERAVSR
jgi:hypothetical protein